MNFLLDRALSVVYRHSNWISWNLFLAFIPLALSFWLFRRNSKSRSGLWWIGFLVFIAFLPNAPYLLTDIVHLINAIRAGYSAWIITLLFIPLHSFAILSGVEAYVISLINQGYYLKQQGLRKWVLWTELSVHALCAVGVYLGRFRRFNSWDFITQPDLLLTRVIDDFTNKKPLLVTMIIFLVITVTYWLMKEVTLGLMLRFKQKTIRNRNREMK